MEEVSNNYKISIVNGHRLCMLKHSRKVRRAGKTVHIYLPEELEDEEILGVVLKDDSHNS